MKHFSYEQWKSFITNEMDETGRKVYEDHLYHCDQCLEVYLDALAECEAGLPVIENEETFTDAVMAKIAEQKVDWNSGETEIGAASGAEAPVKAGQSKLLKTGAKKRHPEKMPFYHRTGFHFLVAAAATFVLLSTGVFQMITEVADSISAAEIEEETPSLTEGLLNKTYAWMDSMNTMLEEGDE